MNRIEVIFAGLRFVKGKMYSAVIPTEIYDGKAEVYKVEKQASMYLRRHMPMEVVGGTYTVEAEVVDGKVSRVVPSSISFRTLDGKADGMRAAWEAVSASAEQEARMARTEKKLAKDNRINEILDELAEVYDAMPPHTRHGFIPYIIAEVSRRQTQLAIKRLSR